MFGTKNALKNEIGRLKLKLKNKDAEIKQLLATGNDRKSITGLSDTPFVNEQRHTIKALSEENDRMKSDLEASKESLNNASTELLEMTKERDDLKHSLEMGKKTKEDMSDLDRYKAEISGALDELWERVKQDPNAFFFVQVDISVDKSGTKAFNAFGGVEGNCERSNVGRWTIKAPFMLENNYVDDIPSRTQVNEIMEEDPEPPTLVLSYVDQNGFLETQTCTIESMYQFNAAVDARIEKAMGKKEQTVADRFFGDDEFAKRAPTFEEQIRG